MKNIAVFGSTGSIGENTLSVIRNLPGKFRVVALSARSDINKLARQAKEFKPDCVCVSNQDYAAGLAKIIQPGVKILAGAGGLDALARDKRIDRIMFAISGAGALPPLLSALDCGKEVALANKEALVMAGPIISCLSKKKKARIIPVDSEQSAIWQCLKDEDQKNVKKIYLTASGGPLRKLNRQALKSVGLKEVLRHPRWKMGKKITVDSATLMNKGLELLEAMFLFDMDVSKIKVLVHPEALIHSMVEFVDGVVIAQLSITDMRVPIQYALAYPERLENKLSGIDFCKTGGLNFEEPDLSRFPCLGLAYEAAHRLGTAPCVLNAANETAVAGFLNEGLRFIDIPEVVEKVMRAHRNNPSPELSDIWEADAWAREEAHKAIGRLN